MAEEEIILENEDGGAETAEAKIKKLRDQLRACQKERQEYLETSQRLKADYVNSRREEEKIKEETVRFANRDLLLELLDLADSFELAFSNKEAWEAVNENWRRGIEYIYAKLEDIFDRNGLTIIDPLGQPFNPQEQHSVATLPTDKPEEENLVLAVVQKGYKMHGRVMRPAKVKVGHYQK